MLIDNHRAFKFENIRKCYIAQCNFNGKYGTNKFKLKLKPIQL